MFKDMDRDGDGCITMMEWLEFLAKLVQEVGHKAVDHRIGQLERISATLTMTKKMVGVE